jgi:hypothetical protein
MSAGRCWAKSIFGTEEKRLKVLHLRTQVLLALLLVLASTAFGLSQLWVFTNMAHRDVGLLNETGVLRAWMLSSSHALRSMLLAAQRKDEPEFSRLQLVVRILVAPSLP